MKWIRRLAAVLFAVFVFAAYLLWPVVFPKDPNELLDITLQDGEVTRQFRIKRGYLNTQNPGKAVEPIDHFIVMMVGVPDMGLPPAWKQGEQHRSMQISIRGGRNRGTDAERIVREWQERGHLPNNGPGFDRYVGQRNGYDVYESLPHRKTGAVSRTLIFKDHDGNLVSSGPDYRAEARILGNLVVSYSSSDGYGLDPKQMRIWVENFVRQIVVPPLPPLPPLPSPVNQSSETKS